MEPDPKQPGNQNIDPNATGNQDQKPDTVDWAPHIPKEYAGEKMWEPLKGKPLGDVLKGYAEGQKMIGGSVRIPKEGASPEEWAALYAKLGRPESPEKYSIKPSAKLQPLLDAETDKEFKTAAHGLGLTVKQAQGLLDWYGGVVEKSSGKLAAAYKETEDSLKREWGGAYDRNLGLAVRTVKEMGGDDLLKYLEDTGLGNHPALIKMLAKVGSTLADAEVISGDFEGVTGPSQAIAKINEIRADRKHAYFHVEDPGHAEALKEMERLHQIAYPG